MEDITVIASGYRADYYYRCRRDTEGRIVDKHYLYCKPHDGYFLFKVVGHCYIAPDENFQFQSVRYVIATDEDAARLQCQNDWRFKPSYALIVKDSAERKRVLSCPRYRV